MSVSEEGTCVCEHTGESLGICVAVPRPGPRLTLSHTVISVVQILLPHLTGT